METNSTNTNQQKVDKKNKRRKAIRKGLFFFWFLFLIGLAGAFLLFYGTKKGWLGEMPDVEELDNPTIYVASEIISSDGKLLDRFEEEKRIPVEYNELPAYLVDALISKEDERFYDHSGIDAKAVARVIFFRGERGGGSTISQQLAELLFTDERSQGKLKRGLQKLKEWIIAVELEKRYTKNEIIAMFFKLLNMLLELDMREV